MEEYAVVGKNIRNIQAPGKATGAAKFGAELQSPGTLTGKILTSPLPHARIIAIDTRRAEKLPGVKAVITRENIPNVKTGGWIKERTVLAFEKVRHVGEHVAAVAAVDEDTAEEAVRLIKVEYEELPVVSDPFEAMKSGSPLVHEELSLYLPPPPARRTSGNIMHKIETVHGDVDLAWKEADLILEGKYSTQFQHAGHIQPHEGVAEIDPYGKVIIRSSTKSPFSLRAKLAEALQLPLSEVRIIATTVGGDFGGKGAVIIEPVCALLALKAGKPVRITMDWADEFSRAFTRSRMFYHIKTGVRKDGAIIAFEADIVVDIGAYCELNLPAIDSVATSFGPYNIPNIKITTCNVYTNNIPTGYVRAPRSPQLNFAVESHLNEVSNRLGIDPIEFRLINCVKEGDVLYDGRILSNVGLGQTLLKTREYIKGNGSQKKKWTGWGISCGQWSLAPLGNLVSRESAAKVVLNEDGTVILITGVAESGGGQLTVMSQIVSEILGVPMGSISVVSADTDACPFEMPTVGSRTTYQVGNTIRQAAEDARRKILKSAAGKLMKDEQELEIRNGVIFSLNSPKDSIPLAQVAKGALASTGGPIIGLSERKREEAILATRAKSKVVDAPDYFTHAALVELDPETGKTTILKYLAVHDVGFAINPMMVEAQVQGGVVFGLGYALTEDTKPDRGRNFVRGLTDYKLPVAPDIPAIDLIFANVPSTYGPFGAKGIGEPTVVPVAAAIANAIQAAGGARVYDLPLTPEKVLKAIKGSPASEQGKR
ncbi:MAG: xanthine dehydrogenase family protein molybdopterin-binding subunit [Dehalococcoidia bacterium]|nr:xanthine dehydrogenase family protein molybdopterin-binding subunit [Dehalococcoidia bacterium]MDZ4246471.1 xanthine dehydrogenase family protein molybdopterin-binding subunit [Dehalococcoidia bacterium]